MSRRPTPLDQYWALHLYVMEIDTITLQNDPVMPEKNMKVRKNILRTPITKECN